MVDTSVLDCLHCGNNIGEHAITHKHPAYCCACADKLGMTKIVGHNELVENNREIKNDFEKR